MARSYEHHTQPLLPMRGFLLRVFNHVAIAFGIVSAFLVLGALGYHYFVDLA